jgi:hypothetical protein
MQLFPDCQRRIIRAISHGKAARDIWEGLGQSEAHAVRIEVNQEGSEGIAKTKLPQIPENDMALEIGEFFYQLRAALDSLIYQVLIYQEGVDPPINGDKSEFPICIDKAKFNSNSVNKAPFPKELMDWLRSIQPYIANKPGHPNYELATYLKLLHDCARLDRHRRLHLVGTAVFEVGVKFRMSPGVTISGIEFVGGNLFEDEAEFLRFKVSGFHDGGHRKIQLESKFGVQIALQDLPVPGGGTLAREMGIIVESVKFVAKHFTECFGGDLPE